ncbi:MAG: BamA/TamA family outer membrane protein [Bacteroidota bacterium]
MNKALLILSVITMFMMGCTGTKYLAENEHFYAGEELNFIQDSAIVKRQKLENELIPIVQPNANAKLLGMRPGVWFYNVAGNPKKEKGFKHWLKYNLGSPPVLVENANVDQMASRLQRYLINEGYFNAIVTGEIKLKKHTGKAIYRIETKQPYTLRNITYPNTDSTYESLMSTIEENSILKKGIRYRLEDLKTEQTRIEDFLEDRGFYYFDDSHLVHLADSAMGDHQVDLTLSLSNDTPERARRKFKIDSVLINPDYSISTDTTVNPIDEAQLTNYEGYTFINNDNYMRPDILAKTVVFGPGDIYSQKAESRTRERLMALGTYKYVDLKFQQSDSSSLTTQIFLTPLPKKSLRLELQALSKSNNFIGPALSASFQNRNTFRGAELLEIKLNASYEVQVGGQNNPPLNAYELNFETSLTIPRLITPFNFDYRSLRFIPQTKMSLGTRLQSRINVFQINSFEARYGFLWQESYTKRHELYPVNLSFVQLSQSSSEFENRLLTDINLARSLEDQFIIGSIYEYTLNTKNGVKERKSRNHYYFNVLLDVSGNLANLTERAIKNDEESSSSAIPYSQYTKVQLDFRYYRKLGVDKELATRLILGAARAYGNSEDVPFIKQFSAGGSNSIRAFRARSLGPGTFEQDIDESSLILDETGDVKIEANLEYRAPIAGVLEGALFLDAGNIWFWESRPDEKPGGSFGTDFLNDLAIGTGAGLRFNFSFFILRFDLAFPLKTPSKWVYDDINPLKRDWRRDNLLLNIAIGYPF